jgi:inorganic pyrophosphatase
LDALVLVINPTFPGILIESRPVGLLRMKDSNKIDNKILCVAKDDPRYTGVRDISDLAKHHLKEICSFLSSVQAA